MGVPNRESRVRWERAEHRRHGRMPRPSIAGFSWFFLFVLFFGFFFGDVGGACSQGGMSKNLGKG
jgi:hypothetical protein